LSTSTNDHETELTKKQAGSFLDASRQEAASGHGGKFSRKRKAHSVTDITECMTELPDYACSEIGGVDRESIRKRPVYGVLGNHDTIRMVPDLEAMGIRMLLNECEPIEREAATIYLAGIDDAHFYRVDNIEKAGSRIPHDVFSILLSHTPEIYRQAAYAGFDLLLSGHTHGGQICLPGSIPLTLGSVLPRRFGAGAWTYHNMAGYTSTGVGSSIVPVRINCLPEVTLHRLRRV